MDPVTAFAAAGAVSGMIGGLIGLYQSEKANKANKERLNEIKAEIDAIVPPDFEYSLEEPPAVVEKRLEQPKYLKRAKSPDSIIKNMSPEELKKLGHFSPKFAQYIDEKHPELLKSTEATKRGREAQMAALERLQQIGGGEYDPEYQELVNKSQGAANSAHQARAASTIQDFSRRGLGGSGLELASQIGSNAASQESQAETAQSAATQAYKNRLAALTQGASLGGEIARGDYDIQERNNNTINNFNQRMSANRQRYENDRVGSENEAEKGNISQYLKNIRAQEEAKRQEYEDTNADIGQENRERDIGYAREKEERDRIRREQLENISSRNENKRYGNTLRQQKYGNQIRKVSASHGISNQQSELESQRAQDRSNAAQGVANAGTNLFLNAADQQEKSARRRRRYEDDEDSAWQRREDQRVRNS